MHNNSLRHHLTLFNRQQPRLRRNINRISPQEESSLIQQRTSNPVIKIIGDCHQHSDLRWLQQVVYDMKRYKIEPSQIQEKNIMNQSVQLKRKPLDNQTNLNFSTNQEKTHAIVMDTAKKSVKKIKFQVYSNKENKVSSGKRQSKIKQRTKKISEPMIKSQEKVFPKQSYNVNCQTEMKKRLIQKEIIIEPCLTDQYSQIFIKQESGGLWSESQKKNLEKSSGERKSAGKIRKNSKTEGSKSNISSTLEKKSLDDPQSMKKPIQKVYIKLQTENLSKYLSQRSDPQQKMSQQIETEEYNKCCSNKSGQLDQHLIQKQANNQIQNDISTTEEIQKKEQKAENKRQISSIGIKKFCYYTSGFIGEKKESDEVKKSKSDQRKLNEKIKGISDQEVSNKKIKEERQFIKSSQTLIKSSDIVIFDTQQNIEKKCNIVSLEEKHQKLFTLNSEREEAILQVSKNNQPIQQSDHDVCFKPCVDDFQNKEVNHEKIVGRPFQIEDLSCSPIYSAKVQINFEKKIVPSIQIQCQEQYYQKQLTLLFEFLDTNKRNLLTSSNCQAQGLTEELKLLFSSIIHQIKTKKRTFNLSKFLKESLSVLQIKKQVYNSTTRQLNRNIISQILKENIELLKKKTPLKQTKEPENKFSFQFGSSSKKNSLKKKQSLKIDSMIEKQDQIDKQYLQKRYNFKDKIKISDIEMEQPELFFQKKYGIVSNKKNNCLVEIQLPSPPRNSNFQMNQGHFP